MGSPMIGEAWHDMRPLPQAILGLVIMTAALGLLFWLWPDRRLVVDIMMTFVFICALLLFKRGIVGMIQADNQAQKNGTPQRDAPPR